MSDDRVAIGLNRWAGGICRAHESEAERAPGGAWARQYALPPLMACDTPGLAVARLPRRLRVPTLMHVMEGRSYCDIAAALDLPAKVVSRRIAQALDRLRSATRSAA